MAKNNWRPRTTYATEQAAKYEKRLASGLAGLYKDARDELQQTVDEYKNHFDVEDARMLSELTAGNITETRYKTWRENALGRGERWETMRDQMAQRMTDADAVAASYINNTTPSIYALSHDFTCYEVSHVGGGVSFTMTNERALRDLALGGNRVSFKTMSINPVRDYEWNQKAITRTLMQGIAQGKSVDKIAKGFLDTMQRNQKAAIRNARTAITSAQAAGTQAAFEDAAEMGIELKKQWLATKDERTRDSHVEIDGQIVGVDEPFSNGLMFPCDPEGAPSEVYNCRCTMISVLPEHEAFNSMDGKAFEEWRENMQNEGIQLEIDDGQSVSVDISELTQEAQPSVVEPQEPEPENTIEPVQEPEQKTEFEDEDIQEGTLDSEGNVQYNHDKHPHTEWTVGGALIDSDTGEVIYVSASNTKQFDFLKQVADINGVEYTAVKQYEAVPTSEEIIAKLAGGDMTTGSCSSLAFAYSANSAGYDVIDYRGGVSTSVFSRNMNIEAVLNLNGVNGQVLKVEREVADSMSLLNSLKADGKEYYFAAGRHAAIVRKTTEGTLEYLEMQSSRINGFMEFTSRTLKDRFRCRTRKTTDWFGETRKFKVFLVDVESLGKSDEFRRVMGYINNAGKQKKGALGTIK